MPIDAILFLVIYIRVYLRSSAVKNVIDFQMRIVVFIPKVLENNVRVL